MKTVIVGGVAAGMSAAARLRRVAPTAEIVVLERSGYVSFANCGLPYYLGGVIHERGALLLQTPEALRARLALDVRVHQEVTAIDPAARTATVRDLVAGRTYSETYDWLVLAPGALPFVPDVPGASRGLTLRSVEDLDAMMRHVARKPRHAVVVGGGFIGIETAENLVARGVAATIVELAPQVLAPLDPEMASMVQHELRSHGVGLAFGRSVTAIDPASARLSDGTVLPADMVVFAIGVRPDTALARGAGLSIGPRGGILVDEDFRTSDPHVFAVGDATEKVDHVDGSHVLVPLANLANRGGRRVADVIAGAPVADTGALGTAIVKVFDLTVAVTGWNEKRARAAGRPYGVIHTHPYSHAAYYPGAQPMALKLVYDPRDGSILGAQAVGRDGVDKRIDVIATAITAGLPAPALAGLELAYAPPYGAAKDPVNILGYIAENRIRGASAAVQWDELDELVANGAVVVDVRSSAEYDAGHIPGARNIPLDELARRLDEVPAGRRVVVCCQAGQRAHTAAAFLAGHGRDVANLDGGWLTWQGGMAARHAAGGAVAAA
ncbi:MAG TPA: FAD-dependent oxidoreductase [Acidimicrobiales bacterium]|nr:FAD-dependent oxidoreductase [Acidimicrobiales bacterium]